MDLLLLLDARFVATEAMMRQAISRLPSMHMKDLLATADRVRKRIVDERVDIWEAWQDSERTVAMAERKWQDTNGFLADITFAICRAVNETARRSKLAHPLRDERRGSAVSALSMVTAYASHLNGLEWVRDSVAFGDLDVDEITDDGETVVKLRFRDPRHSLLRTLALRRSLVMQQFSLRPDRFVREWLVTNLMTCLVNVVGQYRRDTRQAQVDPEIMDKAQEQLEVYLNTIDVEDDMLVVAAEGDPEVLGRYLLAGVLRCQAIGSGLVAGELPRSAARRFLPARIDIDAIVDQVAFGAGEEVVRRAWEEQTVSLPAASHWDLVRQPFVREGPGHARAFLRATSGKWNSDVRERLVQGSKLAKNLGRLWEDHFAERFAETGWDVLGRGIGLRIGGRLVTDLDLLLMRNDLLMIAQVKALAGSPVSAYDHWRQRKVIEKGCRQARLALSRLEQDRSLIQAVAGRQAAERVTHVEAVVLTNSGLHEGWEHLGIPVLGETLLKAITVGSRVDYVDSETKRVVLTRHVLKREDLDTPTIVTALRAPIELSLAPESGEIRHIPESVAGLIILRPEFIPGASPPSSPYLHDVAPAATGSR